MGYWSGWSLRGPVAVGANGAAKWASWWQLRRLLVLGPRRGRIILGHRNRQLWESTRNLYNLVAAGALDHHEVDHTLLQAAERCGLLNKEPRLTHRTLASGRQVGLGPPRPPTTAHQPRTHPPLATAAGSRRANQGGEVMAMPATGHPAG